ncbi:MAG: hypothetical protein SGBAC_013020 [Bacillariaceae sp.]
MASDYTGTFDGNLYLWFSVYNPEGNVSSSLLSEKVGFWLIKEFLCTDGDEMVSIRLVQDALLTSTCHSNDNFRDEKLRRRRLALPADMVVLWNAPTSNITEQYLQTEPPSKPLAYTFWNFSFPVYDWGSANDPVLVQKDVQHLLEQKIWNKELGVPVPGSNVSIAGDEEEEFSMIFLPTMPPTIPPEGITPLLIGPRTVVGEEAPVLRMIGAMLIVVQTILLLLLYLYRAKFHDLQKEKHPLVNERQSVDQMLRASKGFVEIDRGLDTIEPSEQLSTGPMVTTTKKPNGGKKDVKNKGAEVKNKSTKTITTTAAGKKKIESQEQAQRRRSSQSKQKERNSMSSTDKRLQQQTIPKMDHSTPPNRRHSHKTKQEGQQRRRSSHSKQKERDSMSSTDEKLQLKTNVPPKRRNSHEVGSKKRNSNSSRDTNSTNNSSNTPSNGRHSHKVASKKRHSNFSRENNNNNNNNKNNDRGHSSQAANPLLNDERFAENVEMLFQPMAAVSAVRGIPGGQVVVQGEPVVKKHKRHYAVDDTQAL